MGRIQILIGVSCGVVFIAATLLVNWQTINAFDNYVDLRDMLTNRQNPNNQWMASQLHRIERIKNGCKLLKDVLPKGTPRNILVDTNHHVIFCSIPKNACSSWKRLLATLSKKTTVNLTHDQIHSTSVMDKLGIKQLIDLSLKDQEIILKESSKFLVARHPLERLVSAYRDKVEAFDMISNHFFKLRNIMLANYHNANDPNPNVTFPDFVSYLLDPERKPKDEHWDPYSDLCLPCSVDYTYVIDYDDFDTDSEQVLRLLFNSKLEVLPHANVKRLNSKEVYKKYLSMLTNEQVKGLKEKYKNDFLLFGYE